MRRELKLVKHFYFSKHIVEKIERRLNERAMRASVRMRKNSDASDVIHAGNAHRKDDLRIVVGLLVHTSAETQERRIHRRRPFVQVVDELPQLFWSALFRYQRIAAAKANERAVGLVILSTALHDWIWNKNKQRFVSVLISHFRVASKFSFR